MASETERGVCPECGQDVALKRDGTPRKHDCEPPPMTAVADAPDMTVPADQADADLSDSPQSEEAGDTTASAPDVDDPASSEQTPDEPSDDEPETANGPQPIRAGGHINRLDGHGWVVDTKEK